MTVELFELQESARQVMDGAGVSAPEDEIWSQIIELGWLLVPIPENLSGLGAGIQGASAMHMELGRALLAAPYIPVMLAADALCQSHHCDRDAWLERLVGGEIITTTLANSDFHKVGNNLAGMASAVQSADKASHVLVWTACNSIVALVDLSQPGVEVIPRPTWDTARRLFDVRVEGVDLENQTILASGEAAKLLIQRLLSQRDFSLAADAVGGANAILDMTVEHLQTRIQFKRPLAMFQSLKHRCADMKADIVAAEAMLSDTLRKAENDIDSVDARTKAKGAKLFATTMFARVAEDCLQLHGGIGMADEHPCHLYLKRSLLSEQLCGSNNGYAADIASEFV